jgi:hypothetical protein
MTERIDWQPGTIQESPCDSCAHRRGGETCDAYPDGIPKGFMTSVAIHNVPFPGDRGIQFQPLLRVVKD